MSKKGSRSKGRSATSKVAWVLVLILIVSNAATLYYFMYMGPSTQELVPESDVPKGIADIAKNPTDYIGETLTLLGYLVYAAHNYLLVSNPLFYFNNSLSYDNHVMLTGSIPDTMNHSLGLQIAVKGLLRELDPETDVSDFMVDSYFNLTYDIGIEGQYVDYQMKPYDSFAEFSHLIDPTPEKYAILYSGGIKPEKAYSRYWNDIIYMYFILQMHGYKSENIYVIYKDGVGEDSYTPVNYPATHSSLDTVFGILSDTMGRSDTLFFYTTNHGGSGGISVWGPMDSSGALTHTQVSNWLDSITCKNMIIVMEQCVSGKFISYISAENRVILTACKDDESSYGADTEGNWDEFVYHFMCALVGFAWNSDGSTVDADFDDNGLISMREAFIWAAAMDSRPETPWYNDNGDGIGYNVLSVAFGQGPWPGNSIYL